MQPIIDEHTPLDLSEVDILLQEQSCNLMIRDGHVHAITRAQQELHICLVADLSELSPAQFLKRLNEAVKWSLEHVLL
jgi:hypothetical protein